MTPAERRDAVWGCLKVEDRLNDDEVELLYRVVQLPVWTAAQRGAVERIWHRLQQGALDYG